MVMGRYFIIALCFFASHVVFAGEAPFEQPKGRCRRPLLSEL